MKKLLVVPIMVAYYLLMAVLWPIALVLIVISYSAEWVHDLSDQVGGYYEDYLMKPAAHINLYALRIMQSDKTIKWINEASNKLKNGKPIDEEGGAQ